MNIAIYTRKSVFKENSESIDTQIKLCKQYFKGENTFTIFKDDGFSGGNIKRPSYSKLIEECKRGKFDTVAVYKLDRISRNMTDFMKTYELFEKLNVQFISVSEQFDTSTPIGRMMMYFLAVVANLERDNIKQRVTDNMLELAFKGAWTGGTAPFGYEVVKHSDGKSYLKCTNEVFIKEMYEYIAKGYTLYKTHKIMSEKYPDLAFTKDRSMLKSLRSPIHCKSNKLVNDYFKEKGYKIKGEVNNKGYLVYGVTTGEPYLIVSKHKAPISADLWLKVNKELDKRHDSNFKKASKTYWLTNTLKCPYCGSYYVLCNSGKNTYYVCGNRLKRSRKGEKCNNNKYINAEKIENIIQNDLIKSFTNEKEFDKSYNSNKHIASKKDLTKDITSKINSNNTKIENLINNLALITGQGVEKIAEKINKLNKENEELNEELSKVEKSKFDMENIKQNKEAIKKAIDIFKENIDPKEKRRLLQIIFEYIEYDPVKMVLKYEFL